MRLGIYGGTFDPIHFGHLVLAEQCREQCRLDEVWFVPASQPPHKMGTSITSVKSRCEMVEFAISGHAQFRVSRIEVDRPGPSFTVTTLEELHAQDPTRELILLIGADSLNDLPTWRNPKRILELATIAAVNRGGMEISDVGELEQKLGTIVRERIQFVTMPEMEVSSFDIRRRVSEGKSIRYLVPRSVEVYVSQNHLYQSEG